jgi:entericidin B
MPQTPVAGAAREGIPRSVTMKISYTLLMGILLTLAGCNTIEGVGKDVEVGGEKVQEGARAVKKKM